MKNHGLAVTVAALAAFAGTGASAATIVGIPNPGSSFLANFTTTTADAFDVNQGASIIAVNGVTVFPASNAIGDVTPGNEPNNLVFNTSGTQGFTFRTAAPVQLGGFNLYLADDGDGSPASRGYASVTVRGSNDGLTFQTLDTISLAGASYTDAYGSSIIKISSLFEAPVTYQFFQFEGVQRDGGRFAGGRVLELDAVSAGMGAVPEPASWAMMIAGFGMVGGSMRRRRSMTVRFA